jgi:hypothetical protein
MLEDMLGIIPGIIQKVENKSVSREAVNDDISVYP